MYIYLKKQHTQIIIINVSFSFILSPKIDASLKLAIALLLIKLSEAIRLSDKPFRLL